MQVIIMSTQNACVSQVVQQRKDGSVNFNRGWEDYAKGFGVATGEHYIGKCQQVCSVHGIQFVRIELCFPTLSQVKKSFVSDLYFAGDRVV
jgi:hypothetical protein